MKSENNPPIPSFILKDKELMRGWVEQTIADEGHVKYYPKTYRREIVWRRSFGKNLNEYKLHRDEIKMLNKIGIEYDSKNVRTYKTQKGLEKISLQIRIAKRNNLLKLRRFIIIPHKKKDRTLTEITQGFVRYKEPLKVKNTISRICKKIGYVDSPKLKEEMKYKETNTAIKWLKHYSKERLLTCVEKSKYKKGLCGPEPAKYVLI